MEHIDLVNDMYTKVNLNFDRSTENNIKIKSRFENDLDFLFDNEKIDNKILINDKKIKNKINKTKNKNNKYYSYFILFILFMLLNSYYIINLFNSFKLSYYISLTIRGIILIIIYNYIIKNEKN